MINHRIIGKISPKLGDIIREIAINPIEVNDMQEVNALGYFSKAG